MDGRRRRSKQLYGRTSTSNPSFTNDTPDRPAGDAGRPKTVTDNCGVTEWIGREIQLPGGRKGEGLSAFLIFFAVRFSFTVRPGFLAADFRGDLSDMTGHLIQIIDLERMPDIGIRQRTTGSPPRTGAGYLSEQREPG